MRTTVLYARLPGLLAAIARRQHGIGEALPVAVVVQKSVRDVCPQAYRCGVRVGEQTARARRLAPLLHVISYEEIEAHTFPNGFLRSLEMLSPTIELDGPDTAYVDMTGAPLAESRALVQQCERLQTGFPLLLGHGPSKSAARACAESDLPPTRLSEVVVHWLWPEEPLLLARLQRLGLTTFGQVTAIGEAALVYQFGKQGRLLYQRSMGQDFSPVRAQWPPPRIVANGNYALEPIDNEGYLFAALTDLAAHLSQELRHQGRYARRLVVQCSTERETKESEWVLPGPVQEERAIVTALRRLLRQVRLSAPICHIRVRAEDIVLPTATTGNLFDVRAAERQLALAATRQKLRARYGVPALRLLRELPLPRREIRHGLWKARHSA